MALTELETTPSIAVAPEDEKRQLQSRLVREQEWYADQRRYRTSRDIGSAMARELVFVGVNQDIVPAGRFRNPELAHRFPPYLLPGALAAYQAVGRLWRAELESIGIHEPALRLSGSSFVRSEEAQAKIVADASKLASPRSTHCAGGAFDIDASNCYWLDDDKGVMRVLHPDRDEVAMERVAQALGGQPSPPLAPMPYEAEYFDSLVRVAGRLHDEGYINAVLEYVGSANQGLHIAANPYVSESEWHSI